MFGYSLTRPVHNKDYYYGIYDTCEKFKCNIEGWHTESGPGVFEAVRNEVRDSLTANKKPFKALEYCKVKEMADRASLFK